MNRKLLTSLFVLLALLAAACGGRDDGDTASDDADDTADDGADTGDDGNGGEPEPADDAEDPEPADDAEDPEPADDADDAEEPPAVDCSQPLETTEIGVTDTTISLIVMADSDSPLAPGLFDGARDGAFAWADKVNANGGLACRDIEIEFWDSKLNPTETVNGFLETCQSAFALVGTTVLFGNDTSDAQSCPDLAGNPTGVPDLAYITTEPPHQCSTTSFHISRPAGECPYDRGPRASVGAIGAMRWINEQAGGDLSGAFMVPSDLPSTTASSIPSVLAQREAGIDIEFAFGISGLATQAQMNQYLQPLRDAGSTYVYNGSDDGAMLKLRKEAVAQGMDDGTITWVCSLSCYTPDFLEEGGDAVEGTYVWLFFLPFEEADTNDELARFMDSIGTDFPAAWAAGAWADGVLFEQAVNAIVERDGPNALTRQALIDEIRTVTDFDVNGWWGSVSFETTLDISPCFVVLQVDNGEFVRRHPSERGTLDCDPSNVVEVTADPDTFTLDG